jgi:hypothetical protein
MSMNRLRLWGLSAAVAAGVGGPAVAADPPASPPEQTTLIKKLFGPSQPKQPGPTVRSGVPTISGQLPPAVLADALRAEQDAYLRRVSVCTELRRVAVERGDDMLARQADELERQAAALYNARVAGLGVSRVKSPLPDPSGGPGLVSFDMPSSPEAAAKKLTAPATPVPGTTTAQVREVKP